MHTSKIHEHESMNSTQLSNLLICGAVGSLIGAAAALLLAPKSGMKLRRDISNVYEDLFDKTHEIADDIKERTSDFISRPEKNTYLLTGAAGGAVLGAAIAYLLTQENDKSSYFEAWKDKIKDSAQAVENMDWVETAKDFVTDIHDAIHHQNGSTLKKTVNQGQENVINKVLDWAVVGLQVWDKVKKRR
jgi:gas vesicle protein